jgi:coenzyme F420-dependent glucose-6-phosphate dehydrogenase
MVRIGYKASAEQFPPKTLLRFARLAEEVGFDSVFISDHFQPWRHRDGHAPFAMTWLGALGAETERVTIGTSVLTPTLRYHPALVAQSFATLGDLFPARVILGVGTGEALNETPLGIQWPDQKERFARLKEAVDIIRCLWSEERVTYGGTYYRLTKATIYIRPDPPVPIYVAASGPAAARLAGRVGDGLICTSGKEPALYDTLLHGVAEGLARAKRDPREVELMIEMKVSFDEDIERATNDTRNWGALALSAEDKVGIQDPLQMEELAETLPLERVASRWIVSTDPDEHVARIAEYLRMGFRHLVFHSPSSDQEHFLRLYAAQVLPRLRAL